MSKSTITTTLNTTLAKEELIRIKCVRMTNQVSQMRVMKIIKVQVRVRRVLVRKIREIHEIREEGRKETVL